MTNSSTQAASAIESLKMESPVKMQKLSNEENKENLDSRYESDEVAVPIKGIPELPDEPEQPTAATVASTIRDEEKDEPILQENPQRFVLFPIKYHEVRALVYPDATARVKCLHGQPPLTIPIDMADVQEGRSILLDRRGD